MYFRIILFHGIVYIVYIVSIVRQNIYTCVSQ